MLDLVLMSAPTNGIVPIIAIVISWVGDLINVFTKPPAVYFVGVALVGAVAGVTRKFVPMRKR